MLLYVVSPAKTLDLETPVPRALEQRATEPLFLDDAAKLATTMRRKSARQVAALMDLSPALAELNVQRYRDYVPGGSAPGSRPALRTFNGDVYDGLDAPTLGTADVDFAQRHLVILSGLYGVLRPLDRIQPHRLEMGVALATRRGKDLYAYWGDRLAAHLNQRWDEAGTPAGERVLVNLASIEYARAVLRPALKSTVVDCVFEDWKGGTYKIISFFAKRARGAMARWAIQHRVLRAEALAGFDADGYRHDPAASEPGRLVFRRRIVGTP
jgi:cytoplasmic iron level regulating protein YaaA (DUF328/UPF0246 family)